MTIGSAVEGTIYESFGYHFYIKQCKILSLVNFKSEKNIKLSSFSSVYFFLAVLTGMGNSVYYYREVLKGNLKFIFKDLIVLYERRGKRKSVFIC